MAKKEFPFPVVVPRLERRHAGEFGTALKETPHGTLVRLDRWPNNPEVLGKVKAL